MSRIALVAGVTGIVSNNLAHQSLYNGWEAHGITRRASKTVGGFNFIAADLLDATALSAHDSSDLCQCSPLEGDVTIPSSSLMPGSIPRKEPTIFSSERVGATAIRSFNGNNYSSSDSV
ncbi:NAD-dependent epimerase/dehydratase family protein [Granulicella mallensis]|uniref:Nucleoside-diphosphate-sugar epimerase n=1 Tax=Granulicella mallensis TaxID=940614 RepID=A0A7W7ZN46_9BACT|nr:nucleoside-diphosphate-sugar epimerase [Granulicella mallensis]